MALKNAYSAKPIDKIFSDLQQNLVKHGARQIVYEYGDDGRVFGLTLIIPYNNRQLPIKLPAQIEKAGKLLKEQGFRFDDEQVYRVAWRNIEDWVAGQLAFIDIGQVKLEQVFLPYMTDQSGETYFERLEKRGFLLPSGE
jgi:hypothetical protein